jgi:hypothetical protein
MTILSPPAMRLISRAMDCASRHDYAVWAAIDQDTSKDLPDAAIRAALSALASYEGYLSVSLDKATDEDEEVELFNDLGAVRGLQRGLRSVIEQSQLKDAAD